MLGNEGMEKESNNSFCAPTPSAMVFGRSDGDRVAITRDLALRAGYTLQFKVLPWKIVLNMLFSKMVTEFHSLICLSSISWTLAVSQSLVRLLQYCCSTPMMLVEPGPW